MLTDDADGGKQPEGIEKNNLISGSTCSNVELFYN